jgi:hypothetical protein
VKLAGVIALAATLVVATSGAVRASDELTLRGFGTAVIDGVLTPNEWNRAGRYDLQANRSPAEGGGTVPATLYVMNDSTNLYLALRVTVTSLGYSAFDGIFMPSAENGFGPGNDILLATPTFFEDIHWHQVGPNAWDWLADVADGGTRDGSAAISESGGVGVYEVAHPLNSADDLHDFSLTSGSCAGTFMPSSGRAKVVVVSGTLVPPDTRITAGAADGSQVPDYGNWEFVGMDDVTPPSEITFECKVDEEEWSSCESPYGPATTVEGWHTLRVRALDDMLNADPVPEQRRWRIDTQAPSKPKVARSGATLHFSARDRGTPSARLRFRCAIDAKRLHACGSRLRKRLPAGRHVLRVRAVDPAGNESDVKIVRFAVRSSA